MHHGIISGNLVADPELKYLASGAAIANYTVAVNHKTKNNESVSFFRVTTFGKLAEVINQYKKKGQAIMVRGDFQIDNWEDQNGKKRKSNKIISQEVDLNASGGVNTFCFKGNITQDITISDQGTFKVVNNTLAVNYKIKQGDKWVEKTDFIDFSAFNEHAEFLSNYFQKGSNVYLEGRIEIGSYEKEETKFETQKLIVNNVRFGSSKQEDQENQETQDQPDTEADDLDDIDELDDIDGLDDLD